MSSEANGNEPSKMQANDRTTIMTEMQRCLEKASDKGFTSWFRATERGLKCIETNRIYQPNQVTVPNYFRFEGVSDPDDMSIMYEIETDDGCRGTLIDAFGVYSDSRVGKFMREVDEIYKKVPHGEPMPIKDPRGEDPRTEDPRTKEPRSK